VSTEPCITLGSITNFGLYSSSVSCGVLAPEKGNSTVPLLAVFGRRGEFYLAVGVPTDIARVEVVMRPDGVVRRRAQLIGATKAKEARVAPLRFTSFSKRHDGCVQAVVGLDALGGQVFRHPVDECR
jgi:hypothetical protein